ncbi:MAG: hypothetical protein DHS20C11_22560 [Lysobacteraceae bacterium]|nr:MAG: hypothetical protein DHS20C11_22560 [Xanthomonadaceae bacterium]
MNDKTPNSGMIKVVLLLITCLPGVCLAERFQLVMQPVHTPERAAEVYRPLVEYLNTSTSHDFELVTPRNFHHYWKDVRTGNYGDFAFDDAHFVDFRRQRYGYVPLVKSAEPTSFTLVAMPDTADQGLKMLVGRKVVTMPSPSLGSLLLGQWYSNPLQQPHLTSEAWSWRDAVEIVFSWDADAAMVPTWLAQQYPNLLPMRTTDDYPGAAITAAPTVPANVRQQVIDALLALDENSDAYEVLVELNISRFIAASESEYNGYESLLANSFGY